MESMKIKKEKMDFGKKLDKTEFVKKCNGFHRALKH